MAGCFAGALLYRAIEPVLSSLLFHKSGQPADQIWCVTDVTVEFYYQPRFMWEDPIHMYIVRLTCVYIVNLQYIEG